ncbi:hypothetical protein F5Y16DRAFT_403071 [Xylariaceae sp. FL0255]|nr:hypothetical protein F5Y16DRAFT_403071 [Xylariaceae sp. FL0255]
MPHSDNMYSLNSESDNEDQTDQLLSPSDGYFNSSSPDATPRVPNVLVSDPTVERRLERERREAKTKAQEAEEEEISEWSSPAQTQTTSQATAFEPSLSLRFQPSTAHASSPAATPRTPLLRASSNYTRPPSSYSEAPPAYSPSSSNTADLPFQTAPQATQAFRNHNTVPVSFNMGNENDRLLGPLPESMGLPPHEETNHPAWLIRARRLLSPLFGWKMILVTFILMIVILTLTLRPKKTTTGSMPPTDLNWCKGGHYLVDDRAIPLSFDVSSSITFREKIYERNGPTTVQVVGEVDVRRITSGIPRLSLEVVANVPSLQFEILIDEAQQVVVIGVPRKDEYTDKGERPCVQMRATIWVPENAKIGALSIDGPHLDIRFFNDLSLHVANYTTLKSVIGAIHSGFDAVSSHMMSDFPEFAPVSDSYIFDSRVVEVATTSGMISGNWPLYDNLTFHTISGDVEVSITPKEELAIHLKPAALSVHTVSGNVYAIEPISQTKKILPRDYITHIKTQAGKIHGALALGSGMSVDSSSGSVSLELLPVVVGDNPSPTVPARLETNTVSGTSAVQVFEPLRFDKNGKSETMAEPAFGFVDASHHSTSANINLRYPQSWEGLFSASSISGKLSARGKDLQITKRPGQWPVYRLEARKGWGPKASAIEVHTTSGSVDAVIGDE